MGLALQFRLWVHMDTGQAGRKWVSWLLSCLNPRTARRDWAGSPALNHTC